MVGSTQRPRLLIIGGSDAGISAALRAREVAPALRVTVVVADAFPNYSICGLPFYLSGEVPDWRTLAHRTSEEIESQGIELVLDTVAQVIDPTRQIVTVTDVNGDESALQYERLIIATGAEPSPPRIDGLGLPGVYVLHSMADSFLVHQRLEAHTPRSAVIVGGGYIGLEMADALSHRGIAVTLLHRGRSVLSTVDPGFGDVVARELREHDIAVRTGVAVRAIRQDGGQLVVSGVQHDETNGAEDVGARGELVLVATGVRPLAHLAETAGVRLGIGGAIQVTRTMQTNVPGIYAAGDCVETWHRVLGSYTYAPLGTTAHKQGRVAGENAAMEITRAPGVPPHKTYNGSLGTQVVKVFDLVIARTGLLEEEAREAGHEPFTVEVTTWDHKAYYPGAQALGIRFTGDRRSRQLLGAQLIGHWHSEVAKRIDIYATALYLGLRVDELNDLDLSYTPPVSSPWDPVQMAAQAWQRAETVATG